MFTALRLKFISQYYALRWLRWVWFVMTYHYGSCRLIVMYNKTVAGMRQPHDRLGWRGKAIDGNWYDWRCLLPILSFIADFYSTPYYLPSNGCRTGRLFSIRDGICKHQNGSHSRSPNPQSHGLGQQLARNSDIRGSTILFYSPIFTLPRLFLGNGWWTYCAGTDLPPFFLGSPHTPYPLPQTLVLAILDGVKYSSTRAWACTKTARYVRYWQNSTFRLDISVVFWVSIQYEYSDSRANGMTTLYLPFPSLRTGFAPPCTTSPFWAIVRGRKPLFTNICRGTN